MRSVHCLMTGCVLVDKQKRSWIRGDLFENETGTYYILNSTGCTWQFDAVPSEKGIEVSEYWERNGIFVMDSEDVDFNKKAVDYLNWSDNEDGNA